MNNLRFVGRKGKKILQTLIMVLPEPGPYYGRTFNHKYKWVDVQLVEEIEYVNKSNPLTGGGV